MNVIALYAALELDVMTEHFLLTRTEGILSTDFFLKISFNVAYAIRHIYDQHTEVIPTNFVVFCNRPSFCQPSGSHATEDKIIIGVFSSTTVNFISELGRRICVHTGDARETSYLFQRISIMLQRFNSVLLHGTLPVDLPDL